MISKLGTASICFGILVIGCGGSSGGHSTTTVSGAGDFVQTNLVSDQAGIAAVHDVHLVNPWGIAYNPAGGPFWVSDNGTGVSTLYGSVGTIQPLVVEIPAAGGGKNGPVTGQVFNGTTDFQTGGLPTFFIFDSEDGLISAWNGGEVAEAVADESASGAVYKGLALGVSGGANFLYATNFHSGKIDVFDKTFTKTSSFTDKTLPAGFAPFGIANIGGKLFVTFAKQDAAKHDDVPGTGYGYVDVFQTNGTVMRRLISQGALNAPWGLVQAPAGVGNVGGALLVGNFGNGWINAYDIPTGKAIGYLQNTTGQPLAIDGLWGLIFGNNGEGGNAKTLYFTAGPDGETHGLFGSLHSSS